MPTLCTLANLVCGFAAIHYASKAHDWTGPWGWTGLTFAGALVFLGMFFDAIDGAIARLTRSASELGAQLDSLADIITFGVAPAMMSLRLVNYYLVEDSNLTVIGPEADNVFGRIVWVVAALYVCCCALRLARFNVEVGPDFVDHLSFRGLPSPGAAGAVASLVILHQHLFKVKYGGDEPLSFVRWSAFGIPCVMLLCAVAMVSSIRYMHVANRYIYGPRTFGYVVWLVVPLLLAIVWPQEVLAVCFTAYAMSAPLRKLYGRFRGRPTEAAIAGAPHK